MLSIWTVGPIQLFDMPSSADWVKHNIDVDVKPLCQHFYQACPDKQNDLDVQNCRYLFNKLGFSVYFRCPTVTTVQDYVQIFKKSRHDQFGDVKLLSKFDLLKGQAKIRCLWPKGHKKWLLL